MSMPLYMWSWKIRYVDVILFYITILLPECYGPPTVVQDMIINSEELKCVRVTAQNCHM